MNAIEYLKSLPRSWLPKSIIPIREASNSELNRWLKSKSVLINGKTPLPTDDIKLPIYELVFFRKGQRKTTIVKESIE